MSTFKVPLEVGDPAGSRFVPLEGLVGTEATFTVIPRPVLEALGVRPSGQAALAAGDGEVVNYQVGEVRIRLAGQETHAYVAFGEPRSEPLIGSITLEACQLGVDAVNEMLVPVTARPTSGTDFTKH